MGRCNIQNPNDGKWRCWSTIVDDWVSEWMAEADYKQWLVDEATRSAKEEIEEYGIRTSRFINYESCVYSKALSDFCNNCPDQFEKCDDCDYNICVEEYLRRGDDYLNTRLILSKGVNSND